MKILLDSMFEVMQSYMSPFQMSLKVGGLILRHALMLCFLIATFLCCTPLLILGIFW
uniref:Uncharacterized protein n=1 Tax=Arundo donax TaxID=35708 RepID=A0A0A9G488_ARUDO